MGIIPKKTIPEDLIGTFAILARTACETSWTISIAIRASIPSKNGRFTPGRRSVPPGEVDEMSAPLIRNSAICRNTYIP
jgi:hypothetical protein